MNDKTKAAEPKEPYSYSAQCEALRRQIAQWAQSDSKSNAWMARATGLSATTVSQVLSGKYPSDPSGQLRKMMEVMNTTNERAESGTAPYVEGSVYAIARTVCQRARKYGKFGILSGNVGVGKTAALLEYARRTPHTIVIEANPDMTPGVLMRELLEQLQAGVPKSLDEKMSSLVSTLRGTTNVLVIDEADTVQPRCLEYLRRISDKAGVGVVLAGTKRLNQIIKPIGHFDQIRSRVCMWVPHLEQIESADIGAIAAAAMPRQVIAADTLACLVSYAQGSARMLCEVLIPALKDYGLKTHALSIEMIEQVASKILFLQPCKGKRS